MTNTCKDKENSSTQKQFRIIVAGSRHFTDYNKLSLHLDVILAQVLRTHNVVIISGGARGADSLGERYAKEHGLRLIRCCANWQRYGKSAGCKRNIAMAEIAHALVAFPAKDSRGTIHMVHVARAHDLPVRVINV